MPHNLLAYGQPKRNQDNDIICVHCKEKIDLTYDLYHTNLYGAPYKLMNQGESCHSEWDGKLPHVTGNNVPFININ